MVRTTKLIASLLLAVWGEGLGGCTPNTIPEWAMSRQIEPVHRSAHKPRRSAAIPKKPVSRIEPSQSVVAEANLEIFSPEWYKRERARDEELKKRFNICIGC